MTAVLLLMKRVLIPLAKRVSIQLGLLAAMSVANAAFQKNIYGSGCPLDLAWRTRRNGRYNENS